jgi:hypothetical protein
MVENENFEIQQFLKPSKAMIEQARKRYQEKQMSFFRRKIHIDFIKEISKFLTQTKIN